MKRVIGLGGVFFKADDPAALSAWYARHLGFELDENGSVSFPLRGTDDALGRGFVVWSPFASDTRYFEPSRKPFMINLRVHDLDALLAQLRAEGVAVDDRTEEYEFGKFGWIMDPEGNRVELWEPVDAP